MKKLANLLSLLTICVLVLFTACKDDESESLKDKQTRLVSNTWNVSKVEASLEQYSFNNNQITIALKADGTFTATGVEHLPYIGASQEPFPASGTWTFTDTQNFDNIQFKAADGRSVETTVTTLSDNTFVFTYSGYDFKDNNSTVTVTANR